MIKQLIIAIALVVTSARADVIVLDANNVIIAGRNVGTVVDALSNLPAKRLEIHAALVAKFAELTAAKTTAEAALAETQAFSAALVQRAKAAQAKGDRAELAKVIEDAATPAVTRKRAALEAEKAALEERQTALEEQIAELKK